MHHWPRAGLSWSDKFWEESWGSTCSSDLTPLVCTDLKGNLNYLNSGFLQIPFALAVGTSSYKASDLLFLPEIRYVEASGGIHRHRKVGWQQTYVVKLRNKARFSFPFSETTAGFKDDHRIISQIHLQGCFSIGE